MPHKRAKRSVREAAQKERGFNLAPTSSSLTNDTPRSASRILNSWATQQSFKSRGGTTSEDTGDRPRKKAKPTPSAESGPSTSAKAMPTSQAGPSSTAGSHKGHGGSGGATKKGKGKDTSISASIAPIQPHESLGDYNRRVEDALRGGVAKAIKSATAIKAEQARAEKAAKAERRRKAQGLPPLASGGAGGDGSEDEGTGQNKNGKGKRKAAADGDYLEPEDRPVVTFKPAPGPRRLNDVAQAPPSLPKLKGMAGGKDGKGSGAGEKTKKGTTGAGRTDVLNPGQKRLLEEERERVIKQYRDIKAAREKGKAGALEKPDDTWHKSL